MLCRFSSVVLFQVNGVSKESDELKIDTVASVEESTEPPKEETSS